MLTPADSAPAQSAESALRAALLDLLVQMPEHLLETPEGREQIAGQYWLAAGSAHPAVAEVFREAAERVRGA